MADAATNEALMAGATARLKRRRIFKSLCILLTCCAVGYSAMWLLVMLNIAHTLNAQIHDYPSVEAAHQQILVVLLVSLLPFIALVPGAIVLGHVGFRVEGDAPLHARREQWAIGLFALSLVSLIFFGFLEQFAYNVPFFGFLRPLASSIPAIWISLWSIALLATIIGGISIRHAIGSRNQRIWQYLARVAFVLSTLWLLLIIFGAFTLVHFIAVLHLFDVI